MVKENHVPLLLRAGYKSQREGAKDVQREGYSVDNELSSADTRVYYHKNSNRPIIVHRGTRTFADIGTDAMIVAGLGKYTHRYKKAQRINARTQKKYQTEVDHLGHSLGGWIAQNANGSGNVITYNKHAYDPLALLQKSNPKQKDIFVRGDVVSLPSYIAGTNQKKIIDPRKNIYSSLLSIVPFGARSLPNVARNILKNHSIYDLP